MERSVIDEPRDEEAAATRGRTHKTPHDSPEAFARSAHASCRLNRTISQSEYFRHRTTSRRGGEWCRRPTVEPRYRMIGSTYEVTPPVPSSSFLSPVVEPLRGHRSPALRIPRGPATLGHPMDHVTNRLAPSALSHLLARPPRAVCTSRSWG